MAHTVVKGYKVSSLQVEERDGRGFAYLGLICDQVKFDNRLHAPGCMTCAHYNGTCIPEYLTDESVARLAA